MISLKFDRRKLLSLRAACVKCARGNPGRLLEKATSPLRHKATKDHLVSESLCLSPLCCFVSLSLGGDRFFRTLP